jgi:hypothetical protein
MSLDQKFMTHLPSLFAALLATDGPVLEIGAGFGSTPILRAYCQATEREFLSIEGSEQKWADAVGAEYDAGYSTLPRLAERKWSVVFVDNAPALRRGADAMLFMDSSEFVVIHDWESAEVQHGFQPATWRYVSIDTRDPQTATWSITRAVER